MGHSEPVVRTQLDRNYIVSAVAVGMLQVLLVAAQVIVFSQFWTHMMLIGRHLRAAGVRCAELRSHMKAAEKARALHRFRSDPTVSAHHLRIVPLANLLYRPSACAALGTFMGDEALKLTAKSRHKLRLRCPSGAVADELRL